MMERADTDWLGAITDNQAAVSAIGRTTVETDCFLCCFEAGDTDHGWSIAHPRVLPHGPDSVDWHRAVIELVGTFAAHRRMVHVEMIAELAPGLADALANAGAARDSTAAVMVLTADRLRPVPRLSNLDTQQIAADDNGSLLDYLRMQQRCYADPVSIDAWVPILQEQLKRGALHTVVGTHQGRLVSGASLMLGAGMAELAGVCTLPDQRGRGIAADLCARALARHFTDGGGPVWLSAAPQAAGLYRHLGFRRVGTHHAYSAAPQAITGAAPSVVVSNAAQGQPRHR